MIRSIGRFLFVPPGDGRDRFNLRAWFLGFVAWMVVLAVGSQVGLARYESGDPIGMAIWLLALYIFYLSLCNTFFPAPTTWIVMMMASNYVAGEIGVLSYEIGRMVVVAGVGAWGTAMANLNEYHVFTFFLRYGWASRVRKTRLYEIAARSFGIRPFWTLVLFSFIPIPVDVIRWLAITYQYPRVPYFAAYYLGRFVRYSGLAAVTIWGGLEWWHILIIQCAVAGLALAKIVQQFLRGRRADREQAASPEPVQMSAELEDDIMTDPTSSPSEVSNA